MLLWDTSLCPCKALLRVGESARSATWKRHWQRESPSVPSLIDCCGCCCFTYHWRSLNVELDCPSGNPRGSTPPCALLWTGPAPSHFFPVALSGCEREWVCPSLTCRDLTACWVPTSSLQPWAVGDIPVPYQSLPSASICFLLTKSIILGWESSVSRFSHYLGNKEPVMGLGWAWVWWFVLF